jgi:hypothetical protein
VTATHAGAADIKQLPELLHGEEKVLFGDQASWSEFQLRRAVSFQCAMARR